MRTLDEKGFVFLDANNEPHFIRMWGGKPMMFYWHPDKRWISQQLVTPDEIELAYASRLPVSQAELYHNLHNKSVSQ